MASSNSGPVLITGLGIVSSIGHGCEAFAKALFQGSHNFSFLRREGRSFNVNDSEIRFIGAEMAPFMPGIDIDERNMSLSAQSAIRVIDEAWHDAGLDNYAPERISLIVGGSNVQQREILQLQSRYQQRPQYLNPTYGMRFLDTDICGICTEHFNIRGFSYSLGGASASGQLAIIQGAQMVKRGEVDACICVGALMDISAWECQSFRNLGAMGSERFAKTPDLAARPFDALSDGFVFGESCAAIVVSKSNHGAEPYAQIVGSGICMDANRNPNPSADGEINAIRLAMSEANLKAEDIDYINPHGTGSPLGDPTELHAYRELSLQKARINTTKSITGHGLTAAGAVEVLVTSLQIKHQKLHPSRNLENPIGEDFNWVGKRAESFRFDNALCLSLGFGGLNTALCLKSAKR